MTLKLSNIHFVLLAAGESTRFKARENKLLSKIKDKTILEHNIEQLKKIGFKKITLVIRNNNILKSINKTNLELIKGGKTRTLSVKNALLKSKIKAKYLFIHDAARPDFSLKLLKKLKKTKSINGVIPFLPSDNSTKYKNNSKIVNLKRENVY